MTRSILFVCTGNTCRSPMAERIYASLSKASVSSAGTHAAAGALISGGAADALAKRGLAGASHRARRVDAKMVAGADAIYALERAQRAHLTARFPEASSKIFVLREAAGLKPADVADPVGGTAADYEACAAAIEEAVKIIVDKERHAANSR